MNCEGVENYHDFLINCVSIDQKRRCRTESGQRQKINENLNILSKQKDFMGLEIVRVIAEALKDDTVFYCLILSLVRNRGKIKVSYFPDGCLCDW